MTDDAQPQGERRLTNLQQETYLDGGGTEVPAALVDVLAPYQHIGDGFYRWTCGQCRHEHSDRAGWAISGQVLKCDACGRMNLLVRTNCKAIDEALIGKWRSVEMEQENERLKDIQRWNAEQLADIKRRVAMAVEQAISSVAAEQVR